MEEVRSLLEYIPIVESASSTELEDALATLTHDERRKLIEACEVADVDAVPTQEPGDEEDDPEVQDDVAEDEEEEVTGEEEDSEEEEQEEEEEEEDWDNIDSDSVTSPVEVAKGEQQDRKSGWFAAGRLRLSEAKGKAAQAIRARRSKGSEQTPFNDEPQAASKKAGYGFGLSAFSSKISSGMGVVAASLPKVSVSASLPKVRPSTSMSSRVSQVSSIFNRKSQKSDASSLLAHRDGVEEAGKDNDDAAGGKTPQFEEKFVVDNPGSITDFYDIGKTKIGTGTYGSCYQATNKSSGNLLAIKTVAKGHAKKTEALQKEIAIWKTLNHPNIVRLYESFEDSRNIYFVMELCAGGELFDRVVEAGNFLEAQAVVAMVQIFRIVFYLHEKHICHRDLKPENFLFQQKDLPVDKSTLKIIDFGLSTKFSDGITLKTKTGTPFYVAPQVLTGEYNHMCDIWSCGVIMYVLHCGYPPFYGDTDRSVLEKVRLGNYSFNMADWKCVSEDAKDLIRMCLKMNPDERYTAEQCLSHAWIMSKAPKAVEDPPAVRDNLRTYRLGHCLEDAAAHAISQQLGESRIKALSDALRSVDEDCDACLTPAELRAELEKFLDLPSDLQQMFEEEADSSGKLDYTELIAAALSAKTDDQEVLKES